MKLRQLSTGDKFKFADAPRGGVWRVIHRAKGSATLNAVVQIQNVNGTVRTYVEGSDEWTMNVKVVHKKDRDQALPKERTRGRGKLFKTAQKRTKT